MIKKVFQPSQRGKVWRSFILVTLLVIFAAVIDAGAYYNRATDWVAGKTHNVVQLPKTKEIPFRLGLDLQGGTHLVYQADMSKVPSGDQVVALEGVRDVIEKRVNAFGVSEPLVQTNSSGGDYRVIVELAGIKDVNQAIKMIGETPLLEFKEEGTEAPQLDKAGQDKIDTFNKEAEKRAESVLGKVISGGDFAALAKEFSEDTNTKDNGGDLGWINESTDPGIVAKVKDMTVGKTSSDLVRAANGFDIYKLEEKRKKTNPFDDKQIEKEVKASHILICYTGSEGCTKEISKEAAYAKIKEIKAKATPKNFASLAKEYSNDPGAANGGDLGWFGKAAMVEPFSDAVFAQKVGEISFVVETKFGYHIILKEGERESYEYKVSRIFTRSMTPQDVAGTDKNWKNTELSGKNLKRASVQFDPNSNQPQVSLEFDEQGAKFFEDITARNVNKQVAIFLDGYVISSPNVNEKISGGKAVISGSFNIQEAKLLAQRLNAGALPVPINLVGQQTVGASLGNESLRTSLRAGVIGLIFIAVFMILYYRFAGILSVISLFVYGVLLLAIFKIWPVTMTLSGIAGIVLSMGIAVDANVLIFERLKEEMRSGKPLSMAIRESFNRAWPSIRDGNLSTLITCFVLIQLSTSTVKGFAITLGLGVVVSMFSAIIFTRLLFDLLPVSWFENNKWLVGAVKK
ncbi:protein translocase subunit SecD [Patescibacteria group bacterium]|nr:protein translocase subunit SecD [Patescibacteria group bacterium]MBU4309275.1 protein translocase subunit SecD [Patescibacteria group bacterium]MBU4432504.1 protein translocase subunit SecD [Patescibacteria group bacterium]MBU4577636.1 protein translocase subunit SecD [Patescibacteria group bacterium]